MAKFFEKFFRLEKILSTGQSEEFADKEEKYLSDRPIFKKEEDFFQRYEFSKRIAQTVSERKSRESIVFGIFAPWGSGKSSVLNFIEQELRLNPKVVAITFNPWRYSNEDSILKNLFTVIARSLNSEIETPIERNGQKISKYSGIAKVPMLDIEKLISAFSEASTEQLKQRIEQILKETQVRPVIFIDDIDRLDKNEIYALFRIIKLTTNFSNTSYLLFCDEDMVTSAIGERFGSGDKKAGERFLEKIIQVPLSIPNALPAKLQSFAIKLITNVLDRSNLKLSEKEQERFFYQFYTSILNRLTTPRLIVRYANTISFSIPMVKGEVDIVDLLLVEALKIVSPIYYNFVKANPDYFVGSYKNVDRTENRDKMDEVKKKIEELEQLLNSNEKSQLREIVSNLFPILNQLFKKNAFYAKSDGQIGSEQRICYPSYFDRYFSYAVIDGDISDIELNTVLEYGDEKQMSAGLLALLMKSDPQTLMFKLRAKEDKLSWQIGQKVIKALSLIVDKFSKSSSHFFSFGFDTPYGQAAIFVRRFLELHRKEEISSFGIYLLDYVPGLDFAISLNKWFDRDEKRADNLFSLEDISKLNEVILKRALKEAGDRSIFETYGDNLAYLCAVWMGLDKDVFSSSVEEYLNQASINVLTLLKNFIPYSRSSIRKDEYLADITEEVYKSIVSFFDKDLIYKKLLECSSLETIQKETPYLT